MSRLHLVLALAAPNLVSAQSWDLRADFSTEEFPAPWRYQAAAPNDDDFRDLIVPGVARAWVDPRGFDGVDYHSFLNVTVEDAPEHSIGVRHELPADAIFVHPNVERNGRPNPADVVITWTAPATGRAVISGRVAHGHPNPRACGGPPPGNGIGWTIWHNTSTLFVGTTTYAQIRTFEFEDIPVLRGDVIRFRANARGQDGCDWGHVAASITLRPVFQRGDANDDGAFDVSDAVHVLAVLFLGEEPPPCLDSADTDDSGVVDLTDAVGVLQFLFLTGLPPAAPFLSCGPDPTADELPCSTTGPCA